MEFLFLNFGVFVVGVLVGYENAEKLDNFVMKVKSKFKKD